MMTNRIAQTLTLRFWLLLLVLLTVGCAGPTLRKDRQSPAFAWGAVYGITQRFWVALDDPATAALPSNPLRSTE